MNTVIKQEDIQFRTQLQPGDLGYLSYLHGKIYAEECGFGMNFDRYVFDGLNEFAHKYNAEKDRVWICEHEQKIVGFLIAFYRENTVQFRYFILLPEYRSLGLGKKLMVQFIDFMKEKGYTKAYLWTTNEQEKAISLYTKFGFSLTEEKSSRAFDKELIERRYDLDLASA